MSVCATKALLYRSAIADTLLNTEPSLFYGAYFQVLEQEITSVTDSFETDQHVREWFFLLPMGNKRALSSDEINCSFVSQGKHLSVVNIVFNSLDSTGINLEMKSV